MSEAQKIVRNFLTLFSGNVVGQILFFLGTLYLARVFGPTAYGIWSFAQAWQLYLMRFGEVGLEVTAIRETVRRPETTAHWLRTLTVLRLALGVVLLMLTILVAYLGFIPLGSSDSVVLFSLSVVPMAFLSEWVYEAAQNVRVTGAARVVKGLLFLVGVVTLVKTVDQLYESIILYIISLTFPTLVVFILVLQKYGFAFSSFSFASAWQVLKEAAPTGTATILSHYCLFAGTLFTGYLLSQEEVGLYSAAHRVVVVPWAYVFVSFQRVLLPTFVKLHIASPKSFYRFVYQFFKLSSITSLVIGIAGTFWGPAVMRFLYTSAYDESIGTFMILLWALVAAGMRFVFELALLALNRQSQYLKGVAMAALVHSIATPVFALHYGINGAAAAFVVAELLYATYMVGAFSRLASGNLIFLPLKPIFAAALSVCLGWLVEMTFAGWSGVAALISFVALLFMLKEVSVQDLEFLRTILIAEQSTRL